ncbi:MAG: hypothetical protein ABSE80_01470 [Halobacteriota archaeon]
MLVILTSITSSRGTTLSVDNFFDWNNIPTVNPRKCRLARIDATIVDLSSVEPRSFDHRGLPKNHASRRVTWLP